MSKKRRDPAARGKRAPARRASGAATRPTLLEKQWTPVWLAFALAALPVAAFSSVRSFGFVHFDDPGYVTENPHVIAGLTWPGIKWAFTTGQLANWHPLTWLAHMTDVQLFGVNAGAHHIVNLVLHALNTVLLFVFLRRLTGGIWRSALVAALFAVHPLHVESVAWVSERKDVLSTLLWLLTSFAYVAYVRARRPSRYALVMVLLGLGLMAKPMVVTLPFVLLLLDVWPLERLLVRRTRGALPRPGDRFAVLRLVWEKLPLFALAAASSVVTLLVQRSGGAVGSLTAYPLALRLQNAIINYAAYLVKAIWPRPLAAFYPYRDSVEPLQVVASALLIVVISIVVLRLAASRPYLFVGWFWYLITLVPVIGFVQAGMQSMADRYTYIPLIGPFIAAAWGAADIVARWPRIRFAFATTVALVIAALGFVARKQAATWRDSLTLWRHDVDVTSRNAYGEYNLGAVLVKAGRVDEGIGYFRSALRIEPNYSDIHIDLGNALNQRGAVGEALAEFATVVRLRPDFSDARVVYGNMLRARGRADSAMVQYREAIRLSPSMANAHNELGNALTALGRFQEALAEYTVAVRLAPDLAEAHNNIGASMARAGRTDDAIGEFLEALRLKPDAAVFHYNAARVLEGAGRTQEAVDHLQTVLKLDPSNDAARRALDRLAAGRGGGPG